MSVNTMTFEQAAAILNNIKAQVTGETGLAPVDANEFVSVATKTIAVGYEPVLKAITQMVTRTIFSIRPYEAQFRGILMDSQKWGAIVRKLAVSDQEWDDNEEFSLEDGQSVDMFKVKKPNVLQLNYYGAITYQRHYTIFKDQLDSAFSGPDEFSRFMTMVVQNCMDIIEQSREATARATVANFIAGKIAAAGVGGSDGVVHLVSEYNAETGKSLTSTSIYAPENIGNFVKWVYARIGDLTQLMTERSQKFQIQVTGHVLNRHTPLPRQKVYLFSKFLEEINARVKADTFHDTYMELSDVEAISFFQSIEDRQKINTTPAYLLADGTIGEAEEPVTVSNILGVIFDEEALGYTIMNEWSATTPLNAAGGYWNVFYHYLIRYYNDFTEKGIVLLLD
mgnify:FL=1